MSSAASQPRDKTAVDKPAPIFSEIRHGWVDLHIGDINIESISYECDPHADLVEALTGYLADCNARCFDIDRENNSRYSVMVSLFGFTAISSSGNVSYQRMELHEIVDFAYQLVQELTERREEWIEWWSPADEDEWAEYADYFDTLIDALRVELHKENISLRESHLTFDAANTQGTLVKASCD